MKKPDINPYVTARVASSLARTRKGKPSEINECCTHQNNLLPDEADDMQMTALLRCRVCHRGHRYMRAETGELGATLFPLRSQERKAPTTVFFPGPFGTSIAYS